MSVLHSISSISGLTEKLTTYSTTVALDTAMATEVAARTVADNNLKSLIDQENLDRIKADSLFTTEISNLTSVVNTINGDSTVTGSFRKAIADVIGNAPAAFDTLKEIADYIAVNPNANVAAAINESISLASAATANLVTVVNTEKAYLDHLVTTLMPISIDSSYPLIWDGVSNYAKVDMLDEPLMIHNYATGRITHPVTGISYDIPVDINETPGMYANLLGYISELADSSTNLTIRLQYTKANNGVLVRSTF